MLAGVAATLFAFVTWGLLPIFWKALGHVPPSELLAHRVVWTLIVVLLIAGFTNRWREIRRALGRRRTILCFLAASVALGANWYTFIWAVNTGHVVDCSLGYFINPLVNVLLGFALLRERFRSWQLVAIALAAAGVLTLTLSYGQLPWIALVLAGTFAFYGLLRKTAGYEALPGLLLECAVLIAPAAAYLLWIGPASWSAVRELDLATAILVPGTGVVTAAPLVAFAFGARRIRLATVGFIQYLTPTGMLLLGVFQYGESFSTVHAVSFSAIWAGLAVYSAGTVASRREPRPVPPGASPMKPVEALPPLE